MEDQRKHRTKSDKHSDENILELTNEMALSNQDDGDIIDLTKNIDDPDAPSSAAAPTAPAREAQAPPVQPAPVKMDPPRKIEEEVDAAFETVQSEPDNEKREPVPDEQLFDNLTEITARVDEAVGQHESAGEVETEKSPAPDPAMPDDDAITADAAVFEAAIGAEPSEQEEAEPVDAVGAADRPVADDFLEDEEIIELTDIVDPAELEQAALADIEEDEEDILELTDIVDPAEFAAETGETEDIPPTTDNVDPGSIEIPADKAPAQWVEEVAADEPDETPAVAAEEPESAESTEIADMFMEEMMPDEITAEENADPAVGHVLDAALPLAGDLAAEEEEQVIQLSDVLGQADTQERIPIEEIKMGAEEDLAAEPVSLEREDAANALGLNLEMQQKIEAAVKHLLETKYANSFQRLIAEAVEKAVAEQVDVIKRSLRDDDNAKV